MQRSTDDNNNHMGEDLNYAAHNNEEEEQQQQRLESHKLRGCKLPPIEFLPRQPGNRGMVHILIYESPQQTYYMTEENAAKLLRLLERESNGKRIISYDECEIKNLFQFEQLGYTVVNVPNGSYDLPHIGSYICVRYLGTISCPQTSIVASSYGVYNHINGKFYCMRRVREYQRNDMYHRALKTFVKKFFPKNNKQIEHFVTNAFDDLSLIFIVDFYAFPVQLASCNVVLPQQSNVRVQDVCDELQCLQFQKDAEQFIIDNGPIKLFDCRLITVEEQIWALVTPTVASFMALNSAMRMEFKNNTAKAAVLRLCGESVPVNGISSAQSEQQSPIFWLGSIMLGLVCRNFYIINSRTEAVTLQTLNCYSTKLNSINFYLSNTSYPEIEEVMRIVGVDALREIDRIHCERDVLNEQFVNSEQVKAIYNIMKKLSKSVQMLRFEHDHGLLKLFYYHFYNSVKFFQSKEAVIDFFCHCFVRLAEEGCKLTMDLRCREEDPALICTFQDVHNDINARINHLLWLDSQNPENQ